MQQTWLWTRGLLVVATAAFAVGCGSSSDSTGSTSTGGCEGLSPASNAEFCAADPATPDCNLVTGAYKAEVCGVPLKQPTAALARSEDVEEYAGSGPPDLSCFKEGNYPAVSGASTMVTLSGVAQLFSGGCESKDVTIEVFRVKRTGGDDDGDLGDAVGSPITTASDCQVAGVATDDPEKCGTRYECTFSYPNVPTETELLIRTSGFQWAPLYEFNVYIPNDDVVEGVWTHDVRALAQDDYTVIPQAAIGGPVTKSHGVIAGEVHDCENVRLKNATVDIDRDKVITTYFTSNEEHPLPDLSAKATSALGLYAAMDVKPGPVTVAAVGLVDGELTTVGYFKARVFPDAVTAVTFRGLRPFQAP